MNNVLIVGATSDIAQAVAREYASRGCNLALAARDAEELEALAVDLRIRWPVAVSTIAFDALDCDAHAAMIAACAARLGGLDGIVVCHGYLGDQRRGEADFAEARRIIDVNFVSCVSLLHAAADYLERLGSGFIVAISSVAGDRGRRSNYLYGSAKGALSLFLQGLRGRLADKGVAVVTVKPGFVATKMTFGMDGMLLVAQPERIARGICRAVDKRRNVVYLPGFWRLVMLILKAVPEALFKRLPL